MMTGSRGGFRGEDPSRRPASLQEGDMGWGKRKHEQTTDPKTMAHMVEVFDETTETEPQPTPMTTSESCIGRSMRVKGDLEGREDVRIDGTIEGSVRFAEHRVQIGTTGRIQADIAARSVTVEGQVIGNITADDRVEISASGSVLGNIRAGRVVLAEGARFKGSIDMGPVPAAIQDADAVAAKAAIDTGLTSLFGNETASALSLR
jgi:cytoskeletal protein CcmA (bactofilin family)